MRYLGYICVLVLWTISASMNTGCRSLPHGQISDLFISNYRYVVDEQREIVCIYGRLDNMGPGQIAAVEINAILWARTGNKYGENSVVVEHIRPYEKREFALEVSTRGKPVSVELQLREPEKL